MSPIRHPDRSPGRRPGPAGRAPWLALLALLAPCALGSGPAARATDYYVSQRTGDDRAAGTGPASAWRTLDSASDQILEPGDRILLARGDSWPETLAPRSGGTTEAPVTIAAWGDGAAPVIAGLSISRDHVVVEDLVVDRNRAASDAVQIRDATGVVLRRVEVRNGTRDGIDIGRSRDVRIEHSRIHHFLGGSFDQQSDAHGVVATRTVGITISDTEIHQVSGDCFQCDPARDPSALSNDILIERCHLWTGPLEEDFNDGWRRTSHLPIDQQQAPGENGVDTKVLKSGWEDVPRMRVHIRDVHAHGWRRDGFIANKAAFNLKEKIEAVVDGVTVHDCEIAFRIRGTRGGANVVVRNAVVHSSDKGIRAEDDLRDLRVHYSTFGRDVVRVLEFAGGDGGKSTWDVRGNVFVGDRPAVADAARNALVAEDPSALEATFVAPDRHDYRPLSGSSLVEAGEAIEGVRVDRSGRTRTVPLDLGAYEVSTEGDDPHIPPAPPRNVRVVEIRRQ